MMGASRRSLFKGMVMVEVFLDFVKNDSARHPRKRGDGASAHSKSCDTWVAGGKTG